jgi:hypothetical protein
MGGGGAAPSGLDCPKVSFGAAHRKRNPPATTTDFINAILIIRMSIPFFD